MVRSCEQAVAAGLPGVAFTDHLDFTTWTDGDRIGTMDLDPHRYARMHLLDVTGYLAALDDCRQRFPELRIFSGVEIGEAHLWAASAETLELTESHDVLLIFSLLESLTEDQARGFLERARAYTRQGVLAVIATDERNNRNPSDRDLSHITLRDRKFWHACFVETGWKQDALHRFAQRHCQTHPVPAQMAWQVFIYAPG